MNNLIVSFLSELKNFGIHLSHEQGKLKVRAPEGKLTTEIRNRIAENKTDIISLLKYQQENFSRLDKIPKRSSNARLALSNAQQKLWLIDMLEGTSIHYNMPVAMKLEGFLDENAFYRALITVIQRHEILRTVIRVDESGKPYQHINDSFELKFPVIDLTELSEQEQQDVVVKYHVQDMNKPFDLSQDLMVRAGLLRLKDCSHIFLLNLHHISGDGWSFDVLFRELGALYIAYSTGKDNPLPDLPIQYADYSLWMESKFKNDELESQMQFWEKHLAGMPAVHKLPLDKERPEVQTLNGILYGREFDTQTYSALKRFAEEKNVSLFMLLQSAFAALISHCSGESDIVMATPNANRARPELATLIGFFTNTLVLRTQCDLSQPFTEFLASSKETLLRSYENQLIQFDMLVERLNPTRVMAHNALTQITFALESKKKAPVDALTSSTLKVVPAIAENKLPSDRPSKFDLEFCVWETNNGCRFEWTYNRDLFSAETIEAFDRDFELCLRGILANPELPMYELFPLDENKKKQIAKFSGTYTTYPEEETLFDMLETQYTQTPDNTAVVFGELSLSYRELHEKANRLAHSLQQDEKVQPGQLVGLYAERSFDMVIGLLAIIKAGGAYLPLDPTLPEQRITYMLNDSNLSLVLAQTHLSKDLVRSDIRIKQITSDETYPNTALAKTTSSDLPVYAIYTSGSTGQPKGVLNHNKGICNKLRSIQLQYSLASGERMLQKTPSHFDVSVVEIFWPLTTGATTVLSEPEVHKDPEQLYQLMRTADINVVHFVPSMLRLFLQVVKKGELESLRLLFSGGEGLSYKLQLQAISVFPDIELVNQYGPTEAAVDVTYWRFNEPRADKKVPIGYPLPNVQLHVLNKWMQPVPVGVSGELFIGGPQVGIGYLNKEELTNEKFFTLEINGRKERLFRTGDKVKWLNDGSLEYLGRLDDQVKLRGFRIELGEIEAGLVAIKSIESAAVIIRAVDGDVTNDASIIAYITTDDVMSDTDIKYELKKSLPDYMIPSFFVRLSRLPLTPSGKLDRLALPEPELNLEIGKVQLPGSASEKKIFRIFSELLRRENFCVTADFFDLGGHSLLATELRMKLQLQMNVDVPLRLIFEKTSVKELASWFDNTSGSAPISFIEPVSQVQWVPSFAQQSLWFISQFDRDSKYNIHKSFYVTGTLNISALERAFAKLIERHSVFRQVFPVVDGEPELELIASYSPLVVKSLEHLQNQEQLDELEKLSTDHALYPFDVATEALFRAQLVVLGESQYRLMLTLHHLICDGESLPVLMRDLTYLYHAQCGNERPLPSMNLQYGDYAAWQLAKASDEVITAQKEYWLEQLKGAPELLALPIDYPRPPEVSFRGDTLHMALPESLVTPLETFSRKHNCTLFMTLLTGFKALLSIYSGENDISVGVAVNNRSHHQLKNLIGMFVNTLVLRSQVSLEGTFSDAVKDVRKITLDAFSNQDVPFEQIVKEINPTRSLSHNALYQVAFQLDKERLPLEQEMNAVASDLKMMKEVVYDNISKFDLTLHVVGSGGKLECDWEYSTDLFKRETIERMHEHFCRLLQAAMDLPGLAMGLLLQPTNSETLLLEKWCRNSAEYPENETLVDMLDAQLQKTPDNIALIHNKHTISYQELHDWANRYASFLSSIHAVGPGQYVGVYAERSIEMVVALLAIVKTGAAYIPLDPNLPMQRLNYMVTDSQLSVIVSQPQLSENLAQMGLQVVLIHSASEYANIPMNFHIDAGQAAYGIYTSGSTGDPKCALNSHRGICNKLRSIQDQFRLDDGERILHKTPVNFDVSVIEIFWPLTTGATSVLMEQDGHKNPQKLHEIISEMNINIVHFVPSMLRLFIEQMNGRRLTSLRLLLSGGEALSYDLQKQTIAAFPGTELVNQYGPTEAAVDVTAWCFNDLRDDLKVPIGKPNANVELHVLDKKGVHVPLGVSGELYIGGPQVGLGYLHREDLTEKSFVSRKIGQCYERLYRTGDKVRWLADGNLEYLGRLDDQVKLRGFRIELAEIEHHLNQFSSIDSALVLIQNTAENGHQLVAYIKLNPELSQNNSNIEQSGIVQTLKARLSERLPGYMVPEIYVRIEEWPLTFNGKIDKKRLPKSEGMMLQAEYIAPNTDAERKMIGIWSRLLGMKAENISALANFFELGGHSLLSIKLLTEIRRTFDIELALQQLFTLNTVRELAQYCEMLSNEKELSSAFGKSDEVNEFEF